MPKIKNNSVREIFLVTLAAVILLASNVFFVTISKVHLRSGVDLSSYANSANYVHDRMKQVQLNHINKIAPYKVKVEGKQSAQPDRFTIRSASTTIEGQGFYAAIIVENRNPLLTNITADFDKTAVTLTNKPGE